MSRFCLYIFKYGNYMKKNRFTPLNYHKSPIFNLQLQKTWPIQLSKMDKCSLLGGFEGGFVFFFKKVTEMTRGIIHDDG